MKIIQYNIYFGDDIEIPLDLRLHNITDILNAENADIICLQEVLDTSYQYIVGLLADTYPHVYPNCIDGLDIRYDTVIFSKHPIIKTLKHRFEFTSMGRNLKLIQIQYNDTPIYIGTVHFESEFKYSCSNKLFQYKRCAEILEQLYKKSSIPIILCTDTNICKNSEHVFHTSYQYDKLWKDAWIESGTDINKFTFDSYTNPILKIKHLDKAKYRLRLDRILHLSDMYCCRFNLIGTHKDIMLSDHYGISCVFSKSKPSDYREDYREYLDTMNKTIKPMRKLF
jgi:endonuclease/exonuclease/phosphatase family metal-dependent hydrolase